PTEDERRKLEVVAVGADVVPTAECERSRDGPPERDELRATVRDGLREQSENLRAEPEEQHAKRDFLVETSAERHHEPTESADLVGRRGCTRVEAELSDDE